jgi:L-fucose mutarotase
VEQAVLKGIHPLVTPELLGVLAEMGHGDDLAIVDANFPAASTAAETHFGRPIYLPGASLAEAVEAVLSLVPLDSFVDEPVRRMASDEGLEDLPPVQKEVEAVVGTVLGRPCRLGALDRFAFYEAARASYAVVQTGERRWWGDVLLKKGAFRPGDGA